MCDISFTLSILIYLHIMRLIEGKKYKILPCACCKCNEDPFLNAMNDRLGRKVPASIILCLYVGHRSRLFLVQNVSRVCARGHKGTIRRGYKSTGQRRRRVSQRNHNTAYMCASVRNDLGKTARAHKLCTHSFIPYVCFFIFNIKG